MATISIMEALKKIPTNGTTSLVAGIMSATTNMKTVIANSNVIANEIRSPISQEIKSKMLKIWLKIFASPSHLILSLFAKLIC